MKNNRKKLIKYVSQLLGVITIAAIVLIILQLFFSSNGVPAKIEPADNPYLYKYHSSTFDLYAGKDEGQPLVKVAQGQRHFQFILEQKEKTQGYSPVEKKIPDKKSFGVPKVQAAEDVTVVDDSSIVFEKLDSQFLVTPSEDKIELSFKTTTGQDIPSLNIDASKFIPEKQGSEIIFLTRTRKQAFSLKNATIKDAGGAVDKIEMEIEEVQKSDNTTNYYYNISFNINKSWLQDQNRQLPLTIKAEIYSLFHGRFIQADPVKADFASFEKPEFEINPDSVDEPLRSALKNKDYTNLNFGVVDSNNDGRRVPAELIERDGKTFLLFTNGGSFMTPGIYDLLVQYKDDPTLIGKQEFSWGVLALNPDQGIYKPNQIANIDMAVLDHLGRVVCNADLDLEITDPKGNKSTLSTKTKSIVVTPGCVEEETNLPDYTAEYKTSVEGNYSLNLTAVTDNGQFTIEDSFKVDGDSPFYVKRIGPTRTFPKVNYTMRLIIEANRSVDKIVESLPGTFELYGTQNFENEKLSPQKQTLTWDKKIDPGEIVELSYQFLGPEKSPALFLLGPLEIKYQGVEEQIWQEPRLWQLASDSSHKFMAFWDGGTPPTGWVCVSCTGGDDFYQTFPRGATTAGGTGGGTTHTHTITEVSGTNDSQSITGRVAQANFSQDDHEHALPAASTDAATSIPVYQNIKIIRYDTVGDPPDIPDGVIVMFDADPGSGWTRYSAQDGDFIYGENDATGTGGTATHTDTGTITAGAADSSGGVIGPGDQVPSDTHGHDLTVTKTGSDHTSSRVDVLLYENTSGSSKSLAGGEIFMVTGDPLSGWTSLSGSGGDFNNRFLQGASSYAVPAANGSHTPTNFTGDSGIGDGISGPMQVTGNPSGEISDASHVHSYTVSFGSANNLPNYRDTIIAKKDAAASGPTNAQLLRHGAWFDTGVEQPMTF